MVSYSVCILVSASSSVLLIVIRWREWYLQLLHTVINGCVFVSRDVACEKAEVDSYTAMKIACRGTSDESSSLFVSRILPGINGERQAGPHWLVANFARRLSLRKHRLYTYILIFFFFNTYIHIYIYIFNFYLI